MTIFPEKFLLPKQGKNNIILFAGRKIEMPKSTNEQEILK